MTAESRVAEALGRLAVFAVDDFTLSDMLQRLGQVAAELLRVDGAGVMGVSTGALQRTEFVYASADRLAPLESLQETSQTGPCHDAMVTRQMVVSREPAQFTRWPPFAAAAANAGVRVMVAAPLVARGRCWAVLDLYWFHDVALDDIDHADIELLAKVAASYLVIADDRQQADVARQQLAARLLHDTLTGLANRELVYELIHHALANLHRHRRWVALLFLDLDGFKQVNDTLGHRAGDVVLQAVAQRMRSVVRSEDTVSRLGGDEFLVLCEDISEAAAADGLAEMCARMLAAITQPITVEGAPPVRIGASIGVAITDTTRPVADFVHDADQAMYRSKRQPDSPVTVHHTPPADTPAIADRDMLVALHRGQLRVQYQPIVAPTGQTVAVEALLRWQHPTLGLLDAGDFIDLAISTGAIIPAGQWLIGQALADLAAWQAVDGPAAPATVFVNLTPAELIDPRLAAVIDEQLRRCGLPVTALSIEITEQTVADSRAQPAAAYYQQRGHPVALDDFGTGYSSLARLVELPVTHLKLDRILTAQLPTEPQARALLQAVLLIAANMGLQVIGEGVENPAQASYLTDAGCHLQQGFHHGRPRPAQHYYIRHRPDGDALTRPGAVVTFAADAPTVPAQHDPAPQDSSWV